MPTLNYTTTIPAARTVGEVINLLGDHGASAAAALYEGREPVGVSFQLRTEHGVRGFRLPVDIHAMHQLLLSQADNPKMVRRGAAKLTTREHAARVAWRVVKDWLEAQLALVDARMAALDQVMLPYLFVAEDLTLYDQYKANEQKAIGA